NWKPVAHGLRGGEESGRVCGCNHTGCQPPLADIDQQHPEGKGLPLRAQGICATCVTASHPAYVNAATQAANQQAADDRAQQVAEQYLDRQLDHFFARWGGRNTSANMQRTPPPPWCSMAGIGTASR